MTTLTIKIPDHVAEKVRQQAGESRRDVAEVGGEMFLRYLEELEERELALDRAFERDQEQIMAVVEARLADGAVGRPAEEVFADLRARAVADAKAEGMSDEEIDRMLAKS